MVDSESDLPIILTARSTMSIATQPKHYIKREGNFETQEFQIAATQEAFRILSDGLYSDKERAVVRELSTNAADSHIMAKNPDVFEVHLPSYSEPWLNVRDFGTGMSHEQVMQLYPTYFGTNKAGENETTGCLGLGSKSPLCKVRSFTVISRHDGMERHYMVALNEDRLPTINYLKDQDQPTTSSGMEIQLAVSTSDISRYIRSAQSVYRHFAEDSRPRILNCENYSINEKEVLLEGKGWRMYKGSGSPMAIQGNVGYPIASEKIRWETTTTDEDGEECIIDGAADRVKNNQMLLSCNLEIDFPVGSLAFTPSREHLSYNKPTCEALCDRLDEIAKEISATVANRFGNCATLWEARVLAWELFWSTDADLRYLQTLASTGEVLWNGKPIVGKQMDFSGIAGVQGWSFEGHEKTRGNYWNKTVVGTTVKRRDRKQFTPRANIQWCEIDLPRGSYSRCQEWVREHEGIVVNLVQFADKAAKVAFCEKLGLAGTEFIPTSTMPKPAYVSRGGGGGKLHRATSLVYTLNNINCGRLYDYWKSTEVDLDSGDGGVYLEMNNNKVVKDGIRQHPCMAIECLNWLKRLGYDEVEVVGVRPKVAKKFRESDDWVDLWTYMKNLISIDMMKKNIGQAVVNAESYGNTHNIQLWRSLVRYKAELGDELDPHGVVAALVDDVEHMQASRDNCKEYSTWREVCRFFKLDINDKPERDIQLSVDLMLNTFPILAAWHKTIDKCWNKDQFSKEDVQAIAHYVNN
jgi:hypothetical protein